MKPYAHNLPVNGSTDLLRLAKIDEMCYYLRNYHYNAHLLNEADWRRFREDLIAIIRRKSQDQRLVMNASTNSESQDRINQSPWLYRINKMANQIINSMKSTYSTLSIGIDRVLDRFDDPESSMFLDSSVIEEAKLISNVLKRLKDRYTYYESPKSMKKKKSSISGDITSTGIQIKKVFHWRNLFRDIWSISLLSKQLSQANRSQTTEIHRSNADIRLETLDMNISSEDHRKMLGSRFQRFLRHLKYPIRYLKSRRHSSQLNNSISDIKSEIMDESRLLRQFERVSKRRFLSLASSAAVTSLCIYLSKYHKQIISPRWISKHQSQLFSLKSQRKLCTLLANIGIIVSSFLLNEFAMSTLSSFEVSSLINEMENNIYYDEVIADKNILRGDRILSINGQILSGNESIEKIRRLLNHGQENDSVQLGLLRHSIKRCPEFVVVNVKRQIFIDSNADVMMLSEKQLASNDLSTTTNRNYNSRSSFIGSIMSFIPLHWLQRRKRSKTKFYTGYIRIKSFTDYSLFEVASAIEYLHMKIANQTQLGLSDNELSSKCLLDALVLDLRKNPGGSMHSSLDIASLFLPQDSVLLHFRDYKNHTDTYHTLHPKKYFMPSVKTSVLKYYGDIKVLVLVDSFTASASEMLARALQIHHRGFIMGSSTVGKNKAQAVIQLIDTSGLVFTIGEWFDAEGR